MSSTNPVVLAMRRIYCCTGAGFASWELEAGWKEIEKLEAKLERLRERVATVEDGDGWVPLWLITEALEASDELDIRSR